MMDSFDDRANLAVAFLWGLAVGALAAAWLILVYFGR